MFPLKWCHAEGISTVQVLHVERQGTGVLGEWRCQQDMTSESCAVSEVIWPPEVNRNRCEIAFHEFRQTVDAECHIIKVFPAASCQWRYSRVGYSLQTVPSAYVSETKTVISDSDEVYFDSVCKIFRMPLPTAEGEYIFTVVINPGDKRPSVAFTSTNKIEKPAKPYLLPYCTTYIDIDGTNLPPATIICPCNTSSLGHPKGLLQWVDPDGNTIRSGKSAINLLLGDVDREDPNRPYTCVVQHHTGQVNVSYIPRLAYGPSRVSIDVLQQESEYKLECIVRRVMPKPNITWIGPGMEVVHVGDIEEDGSSFTRLITFKVKRDTEVMCLARNPQRPDSLMNDTYLAKGDGSELTTIKATGTSSTFQASLMAAIFCCVITRVLHQCVMATQ